MVVYEDKGTPPNTIILIMGAPFHISQFGAVFCWLACPATSDCLSGTGPDWESGL